MLYGITKWVPQVYVERYQVRTEKISIKSNLIFSLLKFNFGVFYFLKKFMPAHGRKLNNEKING
jgi:hypothetical protein